MLDQRLVNILSNSNESILCLSGGITRASLCFTVLTSGYFEQICIWKVWLGSSDGTTLFVLTVVYQSVPYLTVLASEYSEQCTESVVGFEQWDYSVTVDSNIPVCALPHCTSKWVFWAMHWKCGRIWATVLLCDSVCWQLKSVLSLALTVLASEYFVFLSNVVMVLLSGCICWQYQSIYACALF